MKRSISIAVAVFMVAGVAGVAATCYRSGAGVSAGGAGLSAVITAGEAAGVSRSREPVTVGVPIARSAGITSTDVLELADQGGQRVAAQFEITSRWGGSPGDSRLPARWVLVDFEANAGPNGESRYTLTDGGGGSPGTDLSVTRNDADYLEVSTGVARFVFSKSKFDVFDSVYVGDRRLVSPDGSTGIEAVDSGARGFSSSAGAPREVVLETDGPVRKTVRMRGGLLGPGGELLECVARVSLFAGSSDARVQLTLVNLRDPEVSGDGQPQFWDIGCPGSAAFEDLTFILDCATGGALRLGGVGGGELESTGSLKVYQDSSGGDSWNRYSGKNPRPQSYVSFRGYRVYRDGSSVSSGDRPTPWLGTGGGDGGAVASVRDFWQNYPKALRAAGGRLEVSLFPAEYSGGYSFRPGEQKTHEVTFCFHGPGGEGAAREKARAAQEPLAAAASPAYYLATGALGRVTGPTGDPEFDAYEALNSSTIEGGGNNLFKVIEDAGFFSWQDYGEVPIDYENGGTGSFNHKYNFDLGMALQYMRTGDMRWWRLADAAGRHTADLDLFHHEGRPGAWWDGGFFGHSYHDEENDSNPNRNYGAPHPDLVFGAPGLYQRYYMTGDMVAYEAAKEISDNVRYRFDNSFGRGNGAGYAEAPDYVNGCLSGRSFAHGLWVLVESYRGTGDEGYLETAEWLIENSHQATDLFLTEPVPGDTRFTKLFVWDLLMSSLGKYLDLCAEMGRSDPAGAQGQLVAMARQEAYVMWKEDDRGNRGVPYAWMRDGTPWGWEDREVAVNVSNWQLLTADALTYGFAYSGDAGLLKKAREAFRTGSNPNVEYYEPGYTATKEATNSANFGLAYMQSKSDSASPSIEITRPADGTMAVGVGETTYRLGASATGGNLLWAAIYVDGEKVYETYDPAGMNMGYVWDVARFADNSTHTIGARARNAAGREASAERTAKLVRLATDPDDPVDPDEIVPRSDWYFAEGNTYGNYDEYICILNPESADAGITFKFVLETGRTIQKTAVVKGKSRATFKVKDVIPEAANQNVATHVHSEGARIMAERPMYFNHNGWTGGHGESGISSLEKTWYFAEGATLDGFDTYLTLANFANSDANVTVTYMLGTGRNIDRPYGVPAHSRKTIHVNGDVGGGQDVSTKVSSDRPIAAERPMYFNYKGWTDGHVAAGTSAPAKTWYLAEGNTQDGFDEYICIQNPGDLNANVKITYQVEGWENRVKTYSVGSRSRYTVTVRNDVEENRNVSARIESDTAIVVERPMYFNYQGKWDGGSCVMGSKGSCRTCYMAEGSTRDGFEEWITVMNPSGFEADVYVTYVLPDGITMPGPSSLPGRLPDYLVRPCGRLTFGVNKDVDAGRDVSVIIQTNHPVIVERPMYFDYGGWTGGHCVNGIGL